MERKQEVSKAVIQRLPRYYRNICELKAEGEQRISSKALAERMGLTASQIRQDFNCFGGFGQQGYGYNVEYLYQEIGRLLGLDKTHHLIIIGAGNLGQALANYMNFARRGFIFTGIFDVNPGLYGHKIRGIEVRPMEELAEFVQKNNVDIAVLTIPKSEAIRVSEQLVTVGIKAIWNFAHVDLQVPGGVQVENVHLSDSLMKLSYMLERYEQENSGGD